MVKHPNNANGQENMVINWRIEFLEKQAPLINQKIVKGLKEAPKINDIIHEYVPGFELALKYLPVNKAKELSSNIG